MKTRTIWSDNDRPDTYAEFISSFSVEEIRDISLQIGFDSHAAVQDVSVNTLKKCMHEHYEDCPWREQAMYALDSRNQMLCGYYAFKGQDFQKENLLFIAKGQREDGLLSLCFPTGIDIPIPFFSLVYIMLD